MNIDLKIDSTQLILRLENGQRKLAYAVVNAINATSVRIQKAEFEEIAEAFEIRKPDFFFGKAGKVGGAAAKLHKASVGRGRPFAEIAIEAPDPRGRISGRLLLPIFERGGERTPSHPAASRIAVPVTGGPARPSFGQSIQPAFTWAGMRLTAHRGGKRLKRPSKRDLTVFGTSGRADVPFDNTGVQWKGKNRLFIAVNEEGKGGVFQRTGPGRAGIRWVYIFQRPMQLKKRISWVQTAEQIAAQWFGEEMERETINAIARARGRGL
jgi:hypothetical protein